MVMHSCNTEENDMDTAEQKAYDKQIMAQFRETIDVLVQDLMREKTEHEKSWDDIQDLMWDSAETQWSIYTAQAKDLEWAFFWDGEWDLVKRAQELARALPDDRKSENFAFALTHCALQDRIQAEMDKDIPYCFECAMASVNSLIYVMGREAKLALNI